ncbi:MAG: HAMP domain-containing histidine kinase, partial [Cyanobacteria bacterium]|nr:HAMP domain-containing histidine kinase [Cyanobacteriota bacterium]
LELAFHKVKYELNKTGELKQKFVQILSRNLYQTLKRVERTLAMGCEGEFGMNGVGCERFRKAMVSSNRLIMLIDDLLNLHEIETGTFTCFLVDVDLRDILVTAIDEIRALAENKGVSMELECETTMVSADPLRLRQVLINLMSNAIKYAPPKSKVEVSSSTADGMVEIRVRDHGAGIPEEFKSKLFQAFEQSAQAKPGTGLGLFLSQEIVKKHGGTIGAANHQSGGAVFWITIRRAQT